MERKRTRNANGRSSIYRGKDGYWHGYVTVGVKDNGKPDRRHVRGKNKAEVTAKVRKLERDRDEGKVRKAGQNWTVAQWLDHWLNVIIAPPAITPNAWDAYENAVRVHLIPGIGAHRLEKLEPEHLERLYRKMTAAGSSPGNAHQVHRTVRTALNEAKKRRHITNNPATVAKAPKLTDKEVEPYSVQEINSILEIAKDTRNSARWAIALALGLRQGEALGLHWSDINWVGWDQPCKKHKVPFCSACVDQFAIGLVVRRNRLRPKWRHGCGDTCGRRHAGHCPQRVGLRPETGDTKSAAGKRGIGLPSEVALRLADRRREQEGEQEAAGQLWRESQYVFTTETGEPLHPRTDQRDWKRLLEAAGVSERRLHDARHTAATVLLLLGVAERTVMGVMGWSNTAMAARYQHVIAAIRQDVARQVGGLIWKPTADNGRSEEDTALPIKDV